MRAAVLISFFFVPAVFGWSLRFPRQVIEPKQEQIQNVQAQDQLLNVQPVSDATQGAPAPASENQISQQQPIIMNDMEGSGNSTPELMNAVVYDPVQNERPLQPPEGSGLEAEEGSGAIATEEPVKMMDQSVQQAVQDDGSVSTTISAIVYPATPTSDSLLTNDDTQVEGSGTNEEGQKLLFDQPASAINESEKTVYKYLNANELGPDTETIVFNLTLPTNPQQLLDRILVSARAYSYQQKLDLALRLTEVNHQLMTSIDDDLDMIR